MKDVYELSEDKNRNNYGLLNKDVISNQRKNKNKNNNIFLNDNKESDKIYRINYDKSPSKSKNRNNKFKTPIKYNLLNFEKNFLNLDSNNRNNQNNKNIKPNNLRLKSSKIRDINNIIDIDIINNNDIKKGKNVKRLENFKINNKNNNSYILTNKKIQELKLTIRKTISKIYDKKFKEENEEIELKLKNILLDSNKMLTKLEVLEKNINSKDEIILKINDINNEMKIINNKLIAIDNEKKEEKIRKEKEEKEIQNNIREIKKIEFEERCRKRMQEIRRKKIEEENYRRQELYLRESEKNERRLMIEERIQKLEEEIRIRNLRRRRGSTDRNNNININIRNNRRNNYNEQDNIQTIYNQLPEYKITDINKINKEFPNCIICLSNFRKDNILVNLPCFHPFHKECIFAWIKRNANCPICMTDIKENLNNIEF